VRVQTVGTDKNQGKFEPAPVAMSVVSITGVSGAVRGGSGCKRDCRAALSDPLVAERPGDRTQVGGGGRICPNPSRPAPGPTQPRVPVGTGSPCG
jgi:hypothetical protein